MAREVKISVLIVIVGMVIVLAIILPRVVQVRAYSDRAVEQNLDGKIIRARSFVLEDEYGNLRAALAVDKGEPILALYDKKGKPRVMLGIRDSGAGLVLCDRYGRAVKEFSCK